MPTVYALDGHFEAFVQAQLASGRYTDANDVLRDALGLMEDRERKLGALDASIEQGLGDIAAGHVRDLDEACDELIAEIAALPGHLQADWKCCV
jgi:antitoxin ParD1/3/4